jgi:putative ABC transport system substrate-binding protein
LAVALPGQAQMRAARIGVLSSYPPANAGAAASWSSFYAELASRGWVQGRNLAVEGRYTEGHPERDAAFAEELVAARVDLILATNSGAVAAARRATSSIPIPIVMVNVSHPVEAGFVASLARPGGNVTGVTNQASDMQGKFVELLRAVRPATTRIGVVWSPDNAGSALAFRDVQAVARGQGLALLSLPVERPADLQALLTGALRDGVQALIVHPTPAVVPAWRQIQAWAVEHRVLTLGQAQWVREGFLLSYWANTPDLFRIGATFVDRILRGAAPAELPIEQPTRFELVVNVKTATALGLTIPPSLLLRADEVIR